MTNHRKGVYYRPDKMPGEESALQTTLCMIKPDAVRDNKVADIEKVLIENGFVIVAKKRFQVRGANKNRLSRL